MAADKRSVHTDALDTLGHIIDDTQKRDAVHLAVEPAVAGDWLTPGADVGFLEDGKAYDSGSDAKMVGIVDPFLKAPVRPGARFWLVVYPRQITSLRHVWEHPDFPASGETSVANGRSYSEQWMRDWASKHMGKDYYGDGRLSDDVAYSFAIEAGHFGSVGPYEDAREHITDEWWDHWERLTGKSGSRGSYFSCSC